MRMCLSSRAPPQFIKFYFSSNLALCVTNLFYFQETEKEKEKALQSSGQASIKTSFATSKSTKRKTSAIHANFEFIKFANELCRQVTLNLQNMKLSG